MHYRHHELAGFLLHPFHRPSEKGVSNIADDMCAFNSHHKSCVFCTIDIDLSEVAILKSIDEFEGTGGVECRVTHLNDKTLDIKLIIAPTCPSAPRFARAGAIPP